MNVKKLVMCAFFAAVCCTATLAVMIPTPMGGFVNAGDAVVLLGAFLLGPVWGAAAAGIGSALCDILSGYVVYAPATLVIKALMAFTAGTLLKNAGKTRPVLGSIAAGAVAEVIMIAGYFLYAFAALGMGWGAAADIPANCVQGIFGAAAASALFVALTKIPYVRKTFM